MTDELETDEHIKAYALAKDMIDKIIGEGLSANIAQCAFASAWVTTCMACKAHPNVFSDMANNLVGLYKQSWEEISHERPAV